MSDPITLLNAALDGRYRIERKVGQGGMATVYRAEDLRHGRRVALKVLDPDVTATVTTQRFLSEIRTTASLSHPHILPLFDSGQAGELVYYVMPYVEGESLRVRMERDGELPIDEAVRIAVDLAEALDYAHRHGVIHRDVKPANVLIEDGQVFLSDFGIALALDAAGGERLTGTGRSIGTPYYMSPEQADAAESVDHRADIYSLACMLHEMLSGEPVFSGSTVRAVLAKHLTATPMPIRTLRARVPKGVEAAILRALEKAPADRFSTMGEFAAALRAGVRGASLTLRAARSWVDSVKSHPVAATLSFLAFTGLVTVPLTLTSGEPSWTRPASVVVLPFRESTSTDAEVTFATELADLVGRELQDWDDVDAATNVALAGPRRDLGLTLPTLERIEDGVALAQAVDAQAVVAVTVRLRADSASVEATLIDAESGRSVGEPILIGGSVAGGSYDLELLAPVVASVLGFADAPAPERALGAGTRDAAAARAYLRGLDELARNRLESAEASFRQALDIDPTFASALSALGQTLFWRFQETPSRGTELGPLISRYATTSLDHLADLSMQNSLRVRAFYAFQLGDYEEARRLYGQIWESDPADFYARLLLVEVELLDPWLATSAGGEPAPRQNLNLALRYALETVQDRPNFELAYGRLTRLQQLIERALRSQTCLVFEESRGQLISPWRGRVPSEAGWQFCPVMRDSISWMTRAEFLVADRGPLRNGADRLSRQIVGAFERWAASSPEQPRALEALARVLLLERSGLQQAPPERLAALAEQALEYTLRANALRPDTSSEQLVRLANLHLATGRADQAADLARRAVARYQREGSLRSAPSGLNNVLVATGQISAALELASGTLSRRYASRHGTGDVIALAADSTAERIQVLASAGVTGPPLHAELQDLENNWRAARYSDADRELLRNWVAFGSLGLVTALVEDSVALGMWSAGITVDDPLWESLRTAAEDPERARDAYRRTLEDEGRSADLPPSARAFLLGSVAGKLGLHAEAIRHYSLLDSLPHGLDGFDPGWGLQGIAQLERGHQQAALGHSDLALDHFQRFAQTRAWTDSLSAPRMEEALRGISQSEVSR